MLVPYITLTLQENTLWKWDKNQTFYIGLKENDVQLLQLYCLAQEHSEDEEEEILQNEQRQPFLAKLSNKANITERRSSENYFCCLLRLSINIIISQIMTTIAASESSPLMIHAANFSTAPSSHAAIMTIAIVRISRDSFILLVYYTLWTQRNFRP